MKLIGGSHLLTVQNLFGDAEELHLARGSFHADMRPWRQVSFVCKQQSRLLGRAGIEDMIALCSCSTTDPATTKWWQYFAHLDCAAIQHALGANAAFYTVRVWLVIEIAYLDQSIDG